MRVRVERHSVICGTSQDSAKKHWGQTLHVSLGITQPVNEISGISINTKILAECAQQILRDFDHHTWNFPCPWGLQQHGLSLGLAINILDVWKDNMFSHLSDHGLTNISLSPSNALKLSKDSDGTGLSFRVPFDLMNKFDFYLLANRISLESDLSIQLKTFSPLRYPFENLTCGGNAIVAHANHTIPSGQCETNLSPPIDEVISELSSTLGNKIGGAKNASEAYQVLAEFYSKGRCIIGDHIKIDAIEVSSDKGFSILQHAAESKLEFRLGFNATHELSLPCITRDANTKTYGPCSEFPQHGHRWGLRIRLNLHLPAQERKVDDYLHNAREKILDLWHDLHGSHLNNLTRTISSAPATSEIVLKFIKYRLELADLQPNEIELIETPKNTFLWKSSFDH